VISVDENNHYNHPSLETLNWLKQVKAEILQTKDLGTITLKSDGQSVGF
jgi:beta-lactamase superfamily II metal-dependent hydrolase